MGKKNKKTLEEEINRFFESWSMYDTTDFLRDIIPFFELYDIVDEERWMKDMEDEDERNKVLIRTVYLISKIAERHAGKLCSIKINFKDLYLKMEKRTEEVEALEVNFEK